MFGTHTSPLPKRRVPWRRCSHRACRTSGTDERPRRIVDADGRFRLTAKYMLTSDSDSQPSTITFFANIRALDDVHARGARDFLRRFSGSGSHVPREYGIKRDDFQNSGPKAKLVSTLLAHR
eukprot:1185251-Prorocentrum_minimum.AAC.4